MVKVYTLDAVKQELVKLGVSLEAMEGKKPLELIGLWQERR